jgi:hypothetical protein
VARTSTVTVNVGGNSAISRVTATGTGLGDLIVTGLVEPGPGTGIVPPPGILYEYIDLTPARYTAITGAIISFTVPESWLAEHHINPEQVILYRLTGTGWQALQRESRAIKNSLVYYSAKSTGFSLYAIVGIPEDISIMSSPTEILPVTGSTLPGTGSPVDRINPAGTLSSPSSPLTREPALPIPGTGTDCIMYGIAGCVVLTGIILLVRYWWRRHQNPGLFRRLR